MAHPQPGGADHVPDPGGRARSRLTRRAQPPEARPRLLTTLKANATPNTASGYSQIPHRAGRLRAIGPVIGPAIRNGNSTKPGVSGFWFPPVPTRATIRMSR